MTKRYQVILHSQMGPRTGLLTLEQRESYLKGSLLLMGYENTVRGILAEDGAVHIFHPIRTAVGTLPCETVLMVENGKLTGATTAETCRIRWEGVPLPDDRPAESRQEEQEP